MCAWPPSQGYNYLGSVLLALSPVDHTLRRSGVEEWRPTVKCGRFRLSQDQCLIIHCRMSAADAHSFSRPFMLNPCMPTRPLHASPLHADPLHANSLAAALPPRKLVYILLSCLSNSFFACRRFLRAWRRGSPPAATMASAVENST